MPASIEADDSTTLSVSASDPNGDPLTYNWSKVSGPGLVSFANAGSATTQASFSTQGTYSVRVTVSDGMASASSSTLITVNAPAPDDIISQSGSISLAQSSPDAWQRIDLDQSFTDPVVIFSPLTYNEGEQAHVRVRNVSANYFEWKIEEWDHQDGIHSEESVQYAVFEAGLYTLSDGRVFVAANTVADTRFQTTSFSNTFTEIPIVITQLGSGLSTRAGSAVIDNVTTSSFDVKVLEEKIKGKNDRQEIVSYIALEPGTYQMDGIQEGQIVVDSVDNSWYKLQFDISSPEKQLFFASFQTQNEKYLVDLRIRNLAADSVEVKADQGTISSSAKGGNGQGGGGSKTQEDSKKTFGYIILNL